MISIVNEQIRSTVNGPIKRNAFTLPEGEEGAIARRASKPQYALGIAMRDFLMIVPGQRLALEKLHCCKFDSYGQSTENSTLCMPSAVTAQRNAGAEKLPLNVTTIFSVRYCAEFF